MIINSEEMLENIFKLVKIVKKPLVKIYPDGRLIGTDEQFASLNMIIMEDSPPGLDIPYVFRSTEISAFMRIIGSNSCKLSYDPYEITINRENEILINHIELSYAFDELFNTVIMSQEKPILYFEENFQNTIPEMFALKVADGAKMYSFGIDKRFLMTSFNAIHPANKTDKVNLTIRDYDEYSYTAEFVIYKKKDKYQLHEFLRFRKL